jgi:Asp-tRNA(Asn)/Glu-tRNA(Gln) amidotransferase A subunit family amidase
MISKTGNLSPHNWFRLKMGETVEALLSGHVDFTSVLEGCLRQIRQKDDLIRAFVILTDRDERSDAVGRGPLRGLPVAVKDLYDTCKFPSSYGSAAYAGHRPLADAALVAMLKNKGAIILGKTVTTEFAFSHPGPTRNPHNLDHTPGGSSSGSAAAVASGMAPFALGTQTAGSIIRPASFCGVAGFKPSFGVWPVTGIKCFSWSLDTIGFFAPTHAAMITVLDRLSLGSTQEAVSDTPRLGLVRTPLWMQATQDMQDAVLAAATLARDAGWRVSDVTLDDAVWAGFSAQQTIQAYEAARSLAGEFEVAPHLLSDALKTEIRRGLAIYDDDYGAALDVARNARRRLEDLFGRHDAILTPSAPGSAPEGIQSTGSPDFNRLWTLLGLPCANVPGFEAPDGLPLGVQLVGAYGRDSLLLQVAKAMEVTLISSIGPA